MHTSLEGRALLERFWNTTRDLILLAGAEGRAAEINPRALEVLGYSEADIEDIDLTAIIHPEDQGGLMAARDALLAGRRVHDHETRIRCKDGTWKWLAWSADLDEGELFAVARDITERKNTEHLLAEARAAKAQLQHQRLLLNAASHELHTPLTPMMFGIARLQGHPDADVAAVAEAMDRNARRLQTAIQALLRAADLSSQRIKLKTHHTDIRALLERVAAQEGLSVRPESDAIVFECDEALIEQAVGAMVHNAEEHGQGATALRAIAHSGGVRIEVEDQGPGVEGDPQAYFVPMRRGPETEGKPGAGLGLTTVRLVAETHGGDAGLQCLDHGTLAWLEIPRTCE